MYIQNLTEKRIPLLNGKEYSVGKAILFIQDLIGGGVSKGRLQKFQEEEIQNKMPH